MRASRPVGPRRAVLVVDRIYLACQLWAAAVLLAFIIGSLLFTGGQVLEDDGQIYDEVWQWPVFYVPAWVLVTRGSFPTASAWSYWSTRTRRNGDRAKIKADAVKIAAAAARAGP